MKFAVSPESCSTVWPVQSTTALPLQVMVASSADAPTGRRANPSPRIDPAHSRRSHAAGAFMVHFPPTRCGLLPSIVLTARQGRQAPRLPDLARRTSLGFSAAMREGGFNVRLLSAGPFMTMMDRFAFAPVLIPIA